MQNITFRAIIESCQPEVKAMADTLWFSDYMATTPMPEWVTEIRCWEDALYFIANSSSLTGAQKQCRRVYNGEGDNWHFQPVTRDIRRMAIAIVTHLQD